MTIGPAAYPSTRAETLQPLGHSRAKRFDAGGMWSRVDEVPEEGSKEPAVKNWPRVLQLYPCPLAFSWARNGKKGWLLTWGALPASLPTARPTGILGAAMARCAVCGSLSRSAWSCRFVVCAGVGPQPPSSSEPCGTSAPGESAIIVLVEERRVKGRLGIPDTSSITTASSSGFAPQRDAFS